MFTYLGYSGIISELKNLGYVFSDFSNYSTFGKVFLRHDVDIFIEGVLRMAEVENEMNVRSTWFFQPNNDFYNFYNLSD